MNGEIHRLGAPSSAGLSPKIQQVATLNCCSNIIPMSDHPAYCCYFHSVGTFEDIDDVGLFMDIDWEKRGDYIKSQGEWKIDQTDWSLFVGISHPDEEWRQKDDIEDFIVENFQFLHRLSHCPKVHFHIP